MAGGDVSDFEMQGGQLNMALAVDFRESMMRVLTSINQAATLSVLADADVNGADTFAVLRQRIVSNAELKPGVELKNAVVSILRGFDAGFASGVLSNTALNGKTTVDQLRALCTAEHPQLPTTYAKHLSQ